MALPAEKRAFLPIVSVLLKSKLLKTPAYYVQGLSLSRVLHNMGGLFYEQKRHKGHLRNLRNEGT